MPFFGLPIRNGLPIGLGSVAGFGSALNVVPTGFAVLPAAGAPSYSVTTTVLDSLGTSYTVSTTVLNSAGTAYTPI